MSKPIEIRIPTLAQLVRWGRRTVEPTVPIDDGRMYCPCGCGWAFRVKQDEYDMPARLVGYDPGGGQDRFERMVADKEDELERRREVLLQNQGARDLEHMLKAGKDRIARGVSFKEDLPPEEKP